MSLACAGQALLPAAAQAPARPGVDAPALAALGPFGAGFATRQMGHADRMLRVDLWYPAHAAGPAITYHSSLVGPDGQPKAFSQPGIAVAGAPPAPGRFPLVLLAHGFCNTPEALAWLAENLATKGYVVVAPAFADPPRFDAGSALFAFAHRAPDVAVIAAEAQRLAVSGDAILGHADPGRSALIGYSMGGYGALAAAGAPLAPALQKAAGASEPNGTAMAHLRALVAISPATLLGSLPAFAPNAFAAITAPTEPENDVAILLIAGSQDHVVGYDAVRRVFETETRATRYLLTFREAGHNIALSTAPAEMRARLWDQDWFEDPVWSKQRLIGIEAHFITAFLDRFVKGDASRATYLDGLVPDSDQGRWPDAPPQYGAYSPGPPAASLWTGFQAAHANGMILEYRPAG